MMLTLLLLLAQEADFHVAPNGNDAAAGKIDSPFATIARARDAVRTMKAGKPVTVLLRGGTYFLAETLVFGPEDSNVTYAAFPGEKPVVSGGVPIRGWKVEGDRWVADAPEFFTRQLFVEGRRCPRPRLPKEGFYRIESLPDPAPDVAKGQTRFRYAPGDIRNWRNLADVEVVVTHFWHESRLPVTAVDEAERIVAFGKRSIRRLTTEHGKTLARYYVENVFEALERPGEWYLDGADRKIHYLPRPGEKPDQVEAIVPRLRHIVRVEGAAQLRFRGITFAHSEAYCPARPQRPDELAGPSQAAVTAPGALWFGNARDCSVEEGEIAHVGSYAVEIAAGCSKIRIARNEIHDLGAGGIKVGEMRAGTPTEGNVIADNRLRDGGLIYHSAVGILVMQSGGNTVAHNDVHHFFYTGISVGWTWGYRENPARGNTIEFNHIHDIGQGMLSDMGGIYTLGPSPGTVVRNNLIHDVESEGYGGWGIYPDEGSTGILIENNVVYRTKSGGFHQHYGRDNAVRNNVFAMGREYQIARSRKEDHRSFTFENNIVYWKEGPLWRKGYSDKSGEGYVLDKNLYFRTDGKPFDMAGQSLEEWRKLGHDRASVIADPLFVDPDSGNFVLKPGSPALKLGFRPIDLSTVGPSVKVSASQKP